MGLQKIGGGAESPTYTVNQLCHEVKIAINDIALLKVDTDGYDSECVLSFGDGLKTVSPLLFWENQIDNISQREKFIEMIKWLTEMGYESFFVFDNFGNFQCCVDGRGMIDINYYIGRMTERKSTRSYYYVDVLACKNEHKELCREHIKKYLKKYS